MKKEVSKRILQIISELGINKNKLAGELGFYNSVVSNIVNQRNLPSWDFVYKLKQFAKQVDLNWLFTGEGEKFLAADNGGERSIELYKELLESYKRENELLREKVEILTNDSNLESKISESTNKKRCDS